jgi:hypothetical protein
MTKITQNSRLSKLLQSPLPVLPPALPEAFEDLRMSVDRFCLLAGVEALGEMLAEDAEALCGPRHARTAGRQGHRWGTTRSEIAYHGGKVNLARPRVRDLADKEMRLASWELLSDPAVLQAWAVNLMVLSVSTRKYGRAVRLPGAAGGDLPAQSGDGTSKSAVSRRFVALTRKKLKAWLASNLSDLDLLVIQIDGLHVGDHVMLAAIGIDGGGEKHVLGLAEGASENAATVQALLDNLIARGLDPEVPRLFILDGAKALSKAVRRTFGAAAAIQRCQVHKGRNIIERLDQSLHAGVKKALRQSRAALAQPRAPPGAGGPRGFRLDPGGPGRDPHRDPPGPAARAQAILGLHQRHRERAGDRQDRSTQRQTLEERRDGLALDRRRPPGSQENLPAPQGLPPTHRKKAKAKSAIETIKEAA